MDESDGLKTGQRVRWAEEQRDGSHEWRQGKLVAWEQVAGIMHGVCWTHENGAACVIPRSRLERAP